MPADESAERHFVSVEDPSITLILKSSAGGELGGTLSDGGESMPLIARRSGGGFEGTIGPGGSTTRFTATERADGLVLEVDVGGRAQRLTFRPANRGGTASAPSAESTPVQRRVVINERRLSDEEIMRAEQTYRIRIPDADYWYDRTLGAWGGKGGPTAGFIAPGLSLGGTLRANASAGATQVFVNGRELPSSDLLALQRITGPIVPGRYFINAQGLAGFEGGPPQWNLAAMAAPSGGGGSNSWQSGLTGASGFSDGTTGAVFLPNGGIVSTGN
ncbi:MAG: hypothetical protein HOP12_02495 [Candidatus Eisenbacteria bacterium]|uniref:Uncharacterized protein n=1 Tax=Eiseniibacteriota bacterium TaxID=2212470 RepID=A0A849SV02_UNCEI|nr:hypothetical protein [Candidatus Eisenbacteria bacterium]